MRPHPVADGWAGSLFPEPITQAKPILLDDNSKVLTLLRNERDELYCNCYGMIVKERKCHKCVGYVPESDTCRWVMSVHDAELVNGKPQWAETKPAPEPPWSGKPVDTFAGAAFRQPAPKLESNQDESLDFSKEWYYCASGNAIRNHLPCDECIRSEPREEIHCIRFFKLHPCAYFNSAHCNGSTCEYWSPFGDNPHCTYGPYLAWLAVQPAPAVEPTKLTEWVLLNCGKHHSCRDDCAGRRSGALCPFVIGLDFLKDCVRQGDMPADLLDDRAKDDAEAKAEKKPAKAKKSKPVPAPAPFTKNDQEMQFLRSDIVAIDRLLAELPADHVIERLGFESRKQEHEERLAILAPAVKPAKEQKPAKAKKQPIVPKHDDNYCVLRGGDCAVHNGCQNGDVPCTLKDVPHLEEIHLPCEVHALLDLAVKPVKEPIALLLNGKWYSDGKMLWDCSDCLCLDCANEGKSCHDCRGFERCLKIGGTGGKIGACPDFRTVEGKEQHCLENGCLCFKCQLIGTDCEQCVGPIRCDGSRMKCKDYVGAEVGEVAT